jgi:hypothetical protein
VLSTSPGQSKTNNLQTHVFSTVIMSGCRILCKNVATCAKGTTFDLNYFFYLGQRLLAWPLANCENCAVATLGSKNQCPCVCMSIHFGSMSNLTNRHTFWHVFKAFSWYSIFPSSSLPLLRSEHCRGPINEAALATKKVETQYCVHISAAAAATTGDPILRAIT